MPELPEVQTVVTSLRAKVLGRTIDAVDLRRSDIVTPADCDLPSTLHRRTIVDLSRRGKRIIFHLDVGCFYVHLGMTGQLLIASATDAFAPHTHLQLRFAARPDQHDFVLRFVDPRRFGGIWWTAPGDVPDAGMGPEPLTLRSAALARRLAATTRAIKSALLDQSLIAGLGNIYVDESLFLARIHPLTAADRLSATAVGRLSRAIKVTLRNAIAHRGSTLRDYRDADGVQSRHRVYDRAGLPCRRCRTAIVRIVLGGRSTHFCPKCQRDAR